MGFLQKKIVRLCRNLSEVEGISFERSRGGREDGLGRLGLCTREDRGGSCAGGDGRGDVRGLWKNEQPQVQTSHTSTLKALLTPRPEPTPPQAAQPQLLPCSPVAAQSTRRTGGRAAQGRTSRMGGRQEALDTGQLKEGLGAESEVRVSQGREACPGFPIPSGGLSVALEGKGEGACLPSTLAIRGQLG